MDINGTDGKDTFKHTVLPSGDDWNNYFGKAGDDVFMLYQGAAIGGAGNDTITQLASGDWWRSLQAAYWDSPSGIYVDLQAGYALDGWGTRDTLVGITSVSGSWQGDTILGSSADNVIWVGGGNNIVDGRGGDDIVWLPRNSDTMPFSAFVFDVSVDGKSAVVTVPGWNEFKTTLTNVERIGFADTSYELASFIKPVDMANQGLIAGGIHRWNAASPVGTPTQVSFSFASVAASSGVGATGFAAFTEAQRAVVRTILQQVAAFSGLTFVEVSDSASVHGDLRFGASAQAATKGQSAMPGDANGGSIWMDIESLVKLTPGSEGYAALLHEIGHALGLRHPTNVEAGDAYAVQWRAADDLTSNTVMSQTTSPDGLFPATFSALDITALRTLYGSHAVATGDTVYTLDALRRGAETSIVDDGGNDTLDASLARSAVSIDLTPGHLSSLGASDSGSAAIGNLGIAPGSVIENAIGSAFDDVLIGNSADNRLTGGLGNDWIDGGAGVDTAVFSGTRAEYLISSAFGKLMVTARDGVSGFDTLLNIEQLRFADATIVLGTSAFGADISIAVDQNASVSGSLPDPSDEARAAVQYTLVKGVANGVLTLAKDGAFVYTPRPGFSSNDSFSYTLTDTKGGSNTYTGYIAVRSTGPMQAGGNDSDWFTGTQDNDTIDAAGGNDHIAGSAGYDSLSGGAGLDVLTFTQARAGFTFTAGANGVTTLAKPSATAGTDTLSGIERVIFADGAVALDTDGPAGQAYRIYQAAFDRKPDAAGLGYWLAAMDSGVSEGAVAGGFVTSAEFIKLYGANATAEQFVSRLYNNVLHRAPEQAGYDYWVSAVASGASRADVLVQFAESGENVAQLIAVMKAGMDYLPFG